MIKAITTGAVIVVLSGSVLAEGMAITKQPMAKEMNTPAVNQKVRAILAQKEIDLPASLSCKKAMQAKMIYRLQGDNFAQVVQMPYPTQIVFVKAEAPYNQVALDLAGIDQTKLLYLSKGKKFVAFAEQQKKTPYDKKGLVFHYQDYLYTLGEVKGNGIKLMLGECTATLKDKAEKAYMADIQQKMQYLSDHRQSDAAQAFIKAEQEKAAAARKALKAELAQKMKG
ncbi:hypothetical protein [Actinobacillus delphinicola]|uniref:Uncharacterized protein n=1 Tax=Actinobacillus delphinicola TaxID=51161 RepID=A0A448TRW5_9PAST|nr:hypothetical protein [Actinobacillus delphinicola]VEJ08742.1 Uncharacterised protein [Actinobacillus delphinicola]